MLVKCYTCGKEFDRILSEINRANKLGRKIYCSRSCCGKDNIFKSEKRRARPENLRSGRETDEFSAFRLFWRTAKRRAEEKGNVFNITLENLKQVWDRQKGICPYTGWKLDNPKTSGGIRIKSPTRASLDRKDSSKGYTLENIQFVSYMANCAKNEVNEKELINFCEAGTKNNASSIQNNLSEESHD